MIQEIISRTKKRKYFIQKKRGKIFCLVMFYEATYSKFKIRLDKMYSCFMFKYIRMSFDRIGLDRIASDRF